MKILSEEDIPEEEGIEEEGHVICDEENDPPSLLGLCGEINEESLQDMSAVLIAANKNKILDIDAGEFEDVDDLEFFISSNGGSVGDMFAVYDLMRIVKKNRDIRTYGFGKVSSAAVVLLAAGTQGKEVCFAEYKTHDPSLFCSRTGPRSKSQNSTRRGQEG